MNCKNLAVAFLFLSALQGRVRAQSQESVMNEVSYTFMNKLVDTAKKYYPKMLAFDHRINIANNNIRKARLSWFDVFTFSYLYSPNNATTIVNPSFLNGYQLGLYVNLGSLLTKPHAIREAREQLEINRLEKDEYMRTIEATVKARYFLYVKNVTMLKAMNQGLVDAENAMKDIKYRFEKSETTFDNYSRALLTYADRKQSVIEAEGQVLIAKSSLEELVCKKLEDIR